MSQTYLMLLWHMHQPFYKDLAEDVYTMPWTRMHCLKDYYGMVAILREFPSVHVTFNLVPSLVLQIEDYVRDVAHEPTYDLAFKPVAAMTPADREAFLASAFQLNHENLLSRYPRFRELWEKFQKSAVGTAAKAFTPQEILDLQVLSQVAWFDEIMLAGDPEVSRLVKKERGYSESNKALVRKKEIELFDLTLEEYRQASARGQIELSTSPFYHPILPLLCDTNVAEESHPGVKLPRRRFRRPEDARDQLRSAIDLHERIFGCRPQGLWPSEGSVSDESLRLAAEEGFIWAATDECTGSPTGGHRWPSRPCCRSSPRSPPAGAGRSPGPRRKSSSRTTVRPGRSRCSSTARLPCRSSRPTSVPARPRSWTG